MDKTFKIKPVGDSAISVEFKNEISEEVNNNVAILKSLIESSKEIGLLDVIPTYKSLLIRYNPLRISYETLIEVVNGFMESNDSVQQLKAKIYVIPVYYGGDYGPDLDYVALNGEMTKEDVINIHSSVDYRIYMLGFTPGFPYLGGMDDKIATPRLQQPRTRIHAGSVGIAGKQTGIYPIDSPGGWQIIGKTPLKLFDIHRKNPILLEAGNYIRFKSVDLETYKIIESQVENQSYTFEIESVARGGV